MKMILFLLTSLSLFVATFAYTDEDEIVRTFRQTEEYKDLSGIERRNTYSVAIDTGLLSPVLEREMNVDGLIKIDSIGLNDDRTIERDVVRNLQVQYRIPLIMSVSFEQDAYDVTCDFVFYGTGLLRNVRTNTAYLRNCREASSWFQFVRFRKLNFASSIRILRIEHPGEESFMLRVDGLGLKCADAAIPRGEDCSNFVRAWGHSLRI